MGALFPWRGAASDGELNARRWRALEMGTWLRGMLEGCAAAIARGWSR